MMQRPVGTPSERRPARNATPTARRNANARADERERLISLRAGNWSGYVFAAGVALALFFYLLVPSGDILFYAVFATWIIAQLSEYVVQIILYRSRV